MSHVLVFLADGFEEIEALTVMDYMRRTDIQVTSASLADDTLVRGAHDISVQADRNLNDILGLPVAELSDEGLEELMKAWDAVVLPGGMPGSKNLSEDARVLAMLKAQDRRGGIVAAICAAPLALDAAGLLHGRRHTSFPGIREQLSDATNYVDEELVVADGQLVTSRGPGTAVYFALELIGRLAGRETAHTIAEDILLPQVEEQIKGTEREFWKKEA